MARGRANHRGRIRPPSDHRLESLTKAPRGGEDGNGDGVLDDRHGHRLFSGEMGPPKPATRSLRQSSAPLRHPTGPGVVELDEPGLDRTRAEAEDVVALTTENASDGLPSTTGSQDDPSNRRAVLGQRPDGRVHLCATKEAFVLEPVRRRSATRGSRVGVHEARAERTPYFCHRPPRNVEEGPARVFHQAPAIGDLDRFRRRAGDRLAPAAAAVARDNLDLGGDPPARPRRWLPRGRAECPRSRAARDRRQCRHSDARAAAPRRQCRSRAALAASPAPAPGRSAATYACSPASADGREAPARDGGGCSAVAVLQARQAAGVGGEDVFAEPFREDHSGAVAGRAPEPPHGERDPEAPSVRRQVRNGPHVATMDPARVYATVRAPRPCLARAQPPQPRHDPSEPDPRSDPAAITPPAADADPFLAPVASGKTLSIELSKPHRE